MTKVEVVTINTGVPVPDSYSRYPLDKLNVGDSFEVSLEKRSSLQSSVSRRHKVSDHRYVVRKIDDTKVGVWRVK